MEDNSDCRKEDTDERLWQRICQMPVEHGIRQRRWKWIDNTLRKLVGNSTRQALILEPSGEKERGRPKNTWRHDLEADVKETGYKKTVHSQAQKT